MKKSLLFAGAGAAALAVAGTFVHRRTAEAERRHPPLGRFVEVDGVRLHYIDEGEGPPLLILHGLGSMVEELVLSGLVREASRRYRVVAIDRPGSGHSERPRRWHYGPIEQARLVRSAMKALGIDRPIVVGHSWGALVAAALALEHPGAVRSLVLASGLYFPSPRLDIALYAPPALPLLGALLRRTVSPLASRALLPAWKRTIFAPAPVPAHFEAFPAWLASRPSQLLAVGEEALLTLPAILRLMPRYRRLDLPVVFVAGRGDRYVSARAHTQRLHAMLPTSRLLLSGRAGHMVHHSDLPLVLEAIDQAAWPTA